MIRNDLRPRKVVFVCLLSKQEAVRVAVRVVDLGAQHPGFEPILLHSAALTLGKYFPALCLGFLFRKEYLTLLLLGNYVGY